MRTEIKITGFLVGKIWMPAAECFKQFQYNITEESKRITGGKATLRDHVLRATNDGDFQSCEMGDAVLTIKTWTTTKGGRNVTRSRSWPMECFKSVSDMVRADWLPAWGDE